MCHLALLCIKGAFHGWCMGVLMHPPTDSDLNPYLQRVVDMDFHQIPVSPSGWRNKEQYLYFSWSFPLWICASFWRTHARGNCLKNNCLVQKRTQKLCWSQRRHPWKTVQGSCIISTWLLKVHQNRARAELYPFFVDIDQFSSLQIRQRSNFACCPALHELFVILGHTR